MNATLLPGTISVNEFLLLITITFSISVAVSFLVARFFENSFKKILKRILEDSLNEAWLRYLKFAIYIVGISSGVRLWHIEKYIEFNRESILVILDANRWVLEIYQTVISTLQGIAWLLLVFFIFTLFAYLIIKVFEMKNRKEE